jgi:hypothetical protein
VAIVKGDGNISGVIRFTQVSKGALLAFNHLIKTDKVVIEGEISSLKKGNHGFHVHEKGDLTQVILYKFLQFLRLRVVLLLGHTTTHSTRSMVGLRTAKDMLEI